MEFRGKWVALTGAGSGIGRATALAFADEGAHLALADINAQGLAETVALATQRGVIVRHKNVDVSKADQVEGWADELNRELGAVDVLVNNAGVGLSGNILDTELADWQWILSINLWGVIHGCHYFAPAMIRRGQGGRIVNLASVAGLWASPSLGAYATSKFAVVGYSEALREELRPHDISVTAICPGIVATSIIDSARHRGAQPADDFKQKANAMYRKRNYTPDKVASVIVEAARAGLGTVPVTPEAWFMYLAKRIGADRGARMLTRLMGFLQTRSGIQ